MRKKRFSLQDALGGGTMDVIELNGSDGCTDHRVKKQAGWSSPKSGGE